MKMMKTMKKTITFLLLLAVSITLYAQQVSNVQTHFTGSNIEVFYTLTTNKPVDIELQYSLDDGATYQTCHTVSGDWQSQTSGNKNMTWECAEDGILDANVVFKIGIKQTEIQTTQTETETKPVVPSEIKTKQTDSAEIEMILVKGGIFRMGCEDNGCDPNEKPVHNISLNDFFIGKYEVTQAQWKAIMNNNPSTFRGDDLPVDNVSWYDIQVFIRSLNAKTGKKYRLPTEAEWEYAAKGGRQSKGYTYSGSNSIDVVSWYIVNSGGITHLVDDKQPNELGIYGMSGNVREWCYDWYGRYNQANQANPVGSLSGSERVLRGGWFSANEQYCRNTARNFAAPQSKYSDLGFRLALSN